MNIVLSKTTEAVPIEDLTEVKFDGEGVLDKMLSLHRKHLDREFDNQRIQGKEYADVYLKSYIATTEQAIKFLFAKEEQSYQLNLLAAQLAKTEAEILNVEAQTIKTDTEVEHSIARLPKELALLSSQITKTDTEVEHAIAKLPSELLLLTAQVQKLQADATLAEKQLLLADKELLIKDKELAIKEQELLLKEQELLLSREQLALMLQKVITEKAQTDGSVIQEGSVLYKNNEVLSAQVEGYKRDAEQKTAQLLLQTWLARMNNDAAEINDANGLKDNYIGRTVKSLLDGIGAPTTGFDEADIVIP